MSEWTIAVVHEMLRGDGAAHVRSSVHHEFHSLLRGDVLHNDLEVGEVGMKRNERVLHEERFSIENVNRRIGGFTVDAQRHSQLRHLLLSLREGRKENKNVVHVVDVRHAALAVCGGAGGIVLTRIHDSALLRFHNFLRSGVVRQIPTKSDQREWMTRS